MQKGIDYNNKNYIIIVGRKGMYDLTDMKDVLELNMIDYTEVVNRLRIKASDMLEGLQEIKYGYVAIKENSTMYEVKIEGGEDLEVVYKKEYSKRLNPEYIVYDTYIRLLSLEIKRIEELRDKVR